MSYIINELSKILKTLLISFSIISIEASVPNLNNQYTDDLNRVRVKSLFDFLENDILLSNVDSCQQFIKSIFNIINDNAITDSDLKNLLITIARCEKEQPLKTLFENMDHTMNNPMLGSLNDQLPKDHAVEKLLGLVFYDCDFLQKLLESNECMRVFPEALVVMICRKAFDTSALHNVLTTVEVNKKFNQLIKGMKVSVCDDGKLINTMESAGYVFSRDDLLDNFLKYLINSNPVFDAQLLYFKLIIAASERLPIDDNSQLAISNITYMYNNFISYIHKNKTTGIEILGKTVDNLASLDKICEGTQKIALSKIKDIIIKFLNIKAGLGNNVMSAKKDSNAESGTTEVEVSAEEMAENASFEGAAYLAADLAALDKYCEMEFLSLLQKSFDSSDTRFKATCLNGFFKIIANYCTRQIKKQMEDFSRSPITSRKATELTYPLPPVSVAKHDAITDRSILELTGMTQSTLDEEELQYVEDNINDLPPVSVAKHDAITDRSILELTGMTQSTLDEEELQYVLEDSINDLHLCSTNVRAGGTNFSKKKEVIKKFDKEAYKKTLQDAAQLRELRRVSKNNVPSEANDLIINDASRRKEMVFNDMNSTIETLYKKLSIDIDVVRDKFDADLFTLFESLRASRINDISTIDNILKYVSEDSILHFCINLNDNKVLLQDTYLLYITEINS